ncbi:hypothetical protein VTO42DRAFT_6743 [Malbranchea cinnamomea]
MIVMTTRGAEDFPRVPLARPENVRFDRTRDRASYARTPTAASTSISPGCAAIDTEAAKRLVGWNSETV